MLALIAGTGALPTEMAVHLAEKPLVCALEGSFPDDLTVDIAFRIETLGSFLADLEGKGVSQICMVGAIARPAIDPAAVDAATMPLVPRMMQALTQGDDGALRGVIQIFEDAGLQVLGAHQIVPTLLPPVGCTTRAQPYENAKEDAKRGFDIVTAMSAADVGQACVVSKRQALAIEGTFGTDWMLNSLDRRPDGEKGGIFFKAHKPDQDLRVDMPTIGVDTAQAAATAGLDGLVVAAGGVIVLNQSEMLAECDRLGLFLWIWDPAG